MKYTAFVVSAHCPAEVPFNLGVLVLDEAADRLHFRFRTSTESPILSTGK